MADIPPLISEFSLVPPIENHHEDTVNGSLSSSEDDDGDDAEDGATGLSFSDNAMTRGHECPPLNLVDEEDILALPPEDYGEITDAEREHINIDVNKRRAFSRLETSTENPSLVNRQTNSASSSCAKRKKKKRIYTVNLSNCKYESVRRVLRRFGFREVEEDEEWNLYWTDFSVSIDRVVVMKTWQKINHFPGMSELCRKDSLARNLNRMLKLFPKEYNIFPKTWCLPSDWNEVQNHAKKHKSRTYILKPDTGCQGKGIYITRSFKDIRPMENMICQVYLSKPFLIDGYKFDIRLYVLLTSCDPLRLYVFRDGLVRFTTIPYVEPNQRNMHNMYMHLTNYAVQKHSEGFIRDDEEGGTKRRITTLNRWFKQNGYDLQKIWNDVDDVIIKTVLSGYAVLRHNYRTCFPNHVQTSACFEILGFDVMFNHKLKPFVLEVNHSPSFTTDSKLDREIKESMLYDTLNLAHFGMLSKRKCIEDERKRIRNRLLQKTKKKDLRDATEKEQARYLANSERYEKSHMGNFRLIYPPADTHKYDLFLSPSASFYTETMTYKVRSECARQQREEIRQKREKQDTYQNKHKSAVPPESPVPRKPTAVRSNRNPIRSTTTGTASVPGTVSIEPGKLKTESQVTQHPWGDETPPSQFRLSNSCSPPTSSAVAQTVTSTLEALWKPQPILADEESQRLDALQQRERLMRSIGLIDVIHRLLSNSRGVCTVMSSATTTETKSRHFVGDSDGFKCDSASTLFPKQFHSGRTHSGDHFEKQSSLGQSSVPRQTIKLQNLNVVKTKRTEELDKFCQSENYHRAKEVDLGQTSNASSSQFSTIGQKLHAISPKPFRRHRSATQLQASISSVANGTAAFGTGNMLLASLSSARPQQSPKFQTTYDFRGPSKSALISENTLPSTITTSTATTRSVHPCSNSNPASDFERMLNPLEGVYTYSVHGRIIKVPEGRHEVAVRNFPTRSALPGFRGFKKNSTHRDKLGYLELHMPSHNAYENSNNSAKDHSVIGQTFSACGKGKRTIVMKNEIPENTTNSRTLLLTGTTFRPENSLVSESNACGSVCRTNFSICRTSQIATNPNSRTVT